MDNKTKDFLEWVFIVLAELCIVLFFMNLIQGNALGVLCSLFFSLIVLVFFLVFDVEILKSEKLEFEYQHANEVYELNSRIDDLECDIVTLEYNLTNLKRKVDHNSKKHRKK